MTENDPMAAERLRTIITDRLAYTGGVGEVDNNLAESPVRLSEELLTEFPQVTYERVVNDAGIPVRRVVAAGQWEVDPDAAARRPKCEDRQCPDFGDPSFGEGTCPADHVVPVPPEAGEYGLRGHPVDAGEVQAWIKRRRDAFNPGGGDEHTMASYEALDDLLDDFRDHMVTGTPLADEVAGPGLD